MSDTTYGAPTVDEPLPLPAETAIEPVDEDSVSTRTKLIAAGVAIGLLLLVILIGAGLYSLGHEDESGLERLRDIAIIFSLFFFVASTIAFVAVIAVMAYLVLVIKDEAVPAVRTLTETLHTVQGTTAFVSESVARPIIKASSAVAGWRASIKTITRKR